MKEESEDQGQAETQALTEPCGPPGAGSAAPLPPAAPTLEEPPHGAERLEKIGGGGFGEVWRVRYLGSEEAWKFIPIRPGSSERTGKEAVHARRVDHPNVVRVHDVLRLKDHYVLRMELVRGRDVFRLVNEEGVLPPDAAASYGLQVASALAHAHRQGVVHLDLKPHNLILQEEGERVVVTDFGISASLAQEWGEPHQAAGTAYFMAPEQFEAPTAVDQAIDAWSLGVTLYWAMSLSYPFRFEGRDARDVVRKDPVIPLEQAAPYVPAALCRIVAGLLEKDPVKRLTMEQVVAELEAYGKDPGDVLARAGDRAFALSRFGEAQRWYEESSSGEGPEAERARRLIELVHDAQADHDLLLSTVETRVGADDPAGAFLALHSARRRFSRSPSFKEARGRLEQLVRSRFNAPRRTVDRELRRGCFSEARRCLEILAQLLGIPAARKVIRSASEEGPIDEALVERLRASVEKREGIHRQLTAELERAVQEMDFARARDLMEELQTHFSIPENTERMRAFAAASEHLAFLSEYPLELLERLREGLESPGEKSLHLARAEARCQELLRDFPPQTYPRFEEIALKARALKEIIRSLTSTAGPQVEAIRQAYRRGDLRRVKEGMDAAGEIILHTDIFHKEVRDEVRDIQKQAGGMVERADRLYREGVESLERRQFNKAITALEEAQRLSGGSHDDLDQLLERAIQGAEKRRKLSEDLHSLELTVAAGTGVVAEVAAYLERAAELFELQEDPKRAETLQGAARILEGVVEATARQAVSGAPEKRLEALQDMAAVLVTAPAAFVALAARESTALPGALEALAGVVLGGPSASRRGRDLGDGARPRPDLRRATETFAILNPLLSHPGLIPTRHPYVILADLIVQEAGGEEESPEAVNSQEGVALLERLRDVAPPHLKGSLQARLRRALEAERRRRLLLRGRIILAATGKLALPLGVCLAVVQVAVLASNAVQEKKSSRALVAMIEQARTDERWRTLEELRGARGEELALAMRVVGRDLPAFAALDQVADADARFWGRCLEGARILSSIAGDGGNALGKSGIRAAIETTLEQDLRAAMEGWIDDLCAPFPPSPGARRGVETLRLRLTIAGKVAVALRDPAGNSTTAPLASLASSLADWQKVVDGMAVLVDGIPRLVERAREEEAGRTKRAWGACWDRYRALRQSLPSDRWRRLLDMDTVGMLGRELRDLRASRGSSLGGRDARTAAWEALLLAARIREEAGPLPLDPNWSDESDPLHQVLYPVLR